MNNELYEKYYDQLFKWCLSKTKNYNDAEDLVQEINCQLIIAFSKDVLIINEERFIWKVAYYTWCKKTREYVKNKQLVSLTDELENTIKDQQIDVLKQVEADEIKGMLLNKISDLSEIARKCIILYYYENLSIKEVSEILKIKENLVKYHLHQSRNKLREELKKDDI